MNDTERRDPAEAEALRARTLRRLLPAVVHRLNNALSVVQGVHDLGVETTAEERAQASEALLVLREALERLAALARMPAPGPQRAAAAPSRAHALLLRALANHLRVRLESSDEAHLESGDAYLDGLLVDLAVALLGGAVPAAERAPRIRFVTRPQPGEVFVVLAAVGLAPASDAREALALVVAHARARGWRCAHRCGPRTFALRLGLPVQRAAPVNGSARRSSPRSPRRVLLLHGAGPVRQELSALLHENGHSVAEAIEVPEAGSFEVVLVEQRLVLADPALSARLRARFATERIELLLPRTSPATLLALVR